MSCSHSEFKDLLITQKFTLYQMVEFYIIWILMIQIWYTSRIRIMMTHF